VSPSPTLQPHFPSPAAGNTSYNVSLCKCLLVLSSLPFIKHQTQPTLGKITERKGRKKRTATSPVNGTSNPEE